MRVGILADKYRDRDSLYSMLRASDIEITGIQTTRTFLTSDSETTPDAYLVEIPGSISSLYLRRLVSRSHVPFLIMQDAEKNPEIRNHRLVEKLKGMIAAQDRQALNVPIRTSRSCNAAESNPVLTRPLSANDVATRNLWVLGASIGGPLALARFLSGIPDDLQIAFILVQQIDHLFLEMFVKQLDDATSLPVKLAVNEQYPSCGTVLVVGNRDRFSIGQDGRISISPRACSRKSGTCLDEVIEEVAEYSEERAGVIIFSGSGDDGVRGSHAISRKGGNVWVQSIDSCVIGGMPGNVHRAGIAGFSGTPERLADHLVELCGSNH